MLLQLTEEQEFFRATTAKFLSEQAPPAELRRLRDDVAGFEEKYWRQGADLGWTSLLVSEEHGGGSLSGDGIVDLSLIAFEFGRHAAPGPLVPANLVASTLSSTASHLDVVGELLTGHAVATWCDGVEIEQDGAELVVRGTSRPVEAAAVARLFLVTDGRTQVLIPAGAAGVAVTPMQSVDLTRRFGAVEFADVRVAVHASVGPIGGAAASVTRQRQLALVLANAESVGAMQAAFDMTVEWAFDRYSFGRPLASYQALKHRFADMKSWLEAAHAISDESAAAVSAGAPDAQDLTSAAKAYIGQYGTELLQDCMQLHGGIGFTFEHDLHLYLRRQTVNTAMYGTPSDHRQHLTDLIERSQGAL